MAAPVEQDMVASMRRTLELLELAEYRHESGEEVLPVRELTSIARAKRELSNGIRAEIDAQRAAARALTPEEQAEAAVELIIGMPAAQQSEVFRRLMAELSPAVQREAQQ